MGVRLFFNFLGVQISWAQARVFFYPNMRHPVLYPTRRRLRLVVSRTLDVRNELPSWFSFLLRHLTEVKVVLLVVWDFLVGRLFCRTSLVDRT